MTETFQNVKKRIMSLLQNSVSFAEAHAISRLKARTKVRRKTHFLAAAIAKNGVLRLPLYPP